MQCIKSRRLLGHEKAYVNEKVQCHRMLFQAFEMTIYVDRIVCVGFRARDHKFKSPLIISYFIHNILVACQNEDDFDLYKMNYMKTWLKNHFLMNKRAGRDNRCKWPCRGISMPPRDTSGPECLAIRSMSQLPNSTRCIRWLTHNSNLISRMTSNFFTIRPTVSMVDNSTDSRKDRNLQPRKAELGSPKITMKRYLTALGMRT